MVIKWHIGSTSTVHQVLFLNYLLYEYVIINNFCDRFLELKHNKCQDTEKMGEQVSPLSAML